MELKYKSYTAKAAEGDRFNLYRTRVGESKNGKRIETEVPIGYSYRFEGIVKKIIDLEIAKRENVTTLMGYIKTWKKIQQEVTGILISE